MKYCWCVCNVSIISMLLLALSNSTKEVDIYEFKCNSAIIIDVAINFSIRSACDWRYFITLKIISEKVTLHRSIKYCYMSNSYLTREQIFVSSRVSLSSVRPYNMYITYMRTT